MIFLKKRPEERKITERIDQRCRAVFAVLLIVSLSFVLLSGCSESAEFSAEERFSVSEADLGGLEIAGSMELSYASEFSVDYLSNGGRLIRISDGSCFLMLPEGTERPEGLADEITVLQGPVNRIYLAASAAMDHFLQNGRDGCGDAYRNEIFRLVYRRSPRCDGGGEASLCGKI